MKRTTIMLPDELDARVRYEAKRRNVPVAAVAREALQSYLPAAASGGRLSFFAIGPGRVRDASTRVDELVGKGIARRRLGARGR